MQCRKKIPQFYWLTNEFHKPAFIFVCFGSWQLLYHPKVLISFMTYLFFYIYFSKSYKVISFHILVSDQSLV